MINYQYEIEAQKVGIPQSRWIVSDNSSPFSTREEAESVAKSWSLCLSQYEYRVVEYRVEKTDERSGWYHKGEKK